ncbi:hypothetical protein BY996DRAFT_8683276 [Phakopsora pachyrhizi]|nr:hypothetical protein BY996DRAFT_8683276 [Phakopsora pachyrhizi]
MCNFNDTQGITVLTEMLVVMFCLLSHVHMQKLIIIYYFQKCTKCYTIEVFHTTYGRTCFLILYCTFETWFYDAICLRVMSAVWSCCADCQADKNNSWGTGSELSHGTQQWYI